MVIIFKMSNVKLMDANIKLLRLITLWPNENATGVTKLKRIVLLLSTIPFTVGIMTELFLEMQGTIRFIYSFY